MEGIFAKQAYFTMADIHNESHSSDVKKKILKDFVQRFEGDEKLSKSIEKAKLVIE